MILLDTNILLRDFNILDSQHALVKSSLAQLHSPTILPGNIAQLTDPAPIVNASSPGSISLFGNGGGVYLSPSSTAANGAFVIENTRLLDSTATNGNGGGLWANNTGLDIRGSTFDANHAKRGGGLYASGHNTVNEVATIERSTFSRNVTSSEGGGIYILADASGDKNAAAKTVAITNSTIAQNTASGQGAGMFVQNLQGKMDIQFSTIVENRNIIAPGGAGIAFITTDSDPTALNIDGSIFADNLYTNTAFPVEDDFAVESPGSNDTITTTIQYSAVLGDAFIPSPYTPANNLTDPGFTDLMFLNLQPLGSYGGLTETYHPTLGTSQGASSPLIDFIPATAYSAVTRDQRGDLRPISLFVSNSLDIGAVEAALVQSVLVNDGELQRARLSSIVITFAFGVNAATLAALGGITLTRTAATPAGTVGTVVQTGITSGAFGRILLSATSGTVTSITLTFDNANAAVVTPGVEHGSLADGRWQLAIPSIGYTSITGNTNLRRLYGDSNNDGTVDATDLALAGSLLGMTFTVGNPFDFNQDSFYDSTDFAEFGARFGLTL